MIQTAKEQMMNGGPLAYAMDASGGFMSYRTGVYHASCTSNPSHAVTAVGWGQTQEGVKYIHSLNSWGPYWGESGAFKITECGVTHLFKFDFTLDDADVPSPLLAPDGSTPEQTPAPTPQEGPAPAPEGPAPAPDPTPAADHPWS